MTTIKDYLRTLTNYRDNLVIYMQLRLDDLLRQKKPNGDIFPTLSIPQITKLLAEINLCNHYINYLHSWDNYYNGPVIPFDNTEIIKRVEEYIYKTEDDTNSYRIDNPEK